MGFFKDKVSLTGDLKKLDNEYGNIISKYIKNSNFKAEKGEAKSIFANKNVKNRGNNCIIFACVGSGGGGGAGARESAAGFSREHRGRRVGQPVLGGDRLAPVTIG